MAAIVAWYNNQYSTWNRTRRLHQQPFLARVDTRASRRATEMAQEAVVINMGDVASPEHTDSQKKSDTLFGPNIGIVNAGPEWADRHEKSVDELTPEIVKSWISKSKEVRCPSDDPNHADSQHHHGLEFEFDCDAPKCGISVQVLLSPKHRLSGKYDASGMSKFLVFESVVDGGFGKTLKLEEGATLELGRFEHRPDAPTAEKDNPGDASFGADAESHHVVDPSSDTATSAWNRKRFTNFNFRKREHDRSVAGPAIAVLDAEVNSHGDDDKSKEYDKDEIDVGVRVTIRLSALDEEGKELPSVNEQVTYLHVVRFGIPPTVIEGVPVEDNRPWVVKVVKREATIGPHSFHLHEIYGLSSNSTTASQPVATTPPTDTHVYPPATEPSATPHEDEPSSECLLCLSSPREVVLLPCRHLVACRECAINMIEFGAGGNIVHQEDETNATTGTEGANGENGNATDGNTAGVPPGSEADAPQPVPVIPINPRRKRKAKGWFCPVCRQPYTSLLRITTTPPSKDEKDDPRESTDGDDRDDLPPSPSITVPSPTANVGRTGVPSRGGFFRSFRPGALQPDVERVQALGPFA
ncbi:hypothetical protein SCP_2000160 [Sparassis crispa]|uniref:RING-type domain-containing protein n=1 Tax=Sparassis crispa TaxID=139825 RepID=A0A401H7D7_9APHY|nr:hypothetical protein SCP_2000160 [Sparassis crispa]GBE90273.1 hypothetical protein SCP_2000160 [Sparassis crispa]